MFYVRSPDVTLVGSSPEIMCRVVDGEITLRPLAGTRKRGVDEEDLVLPLDANVAVVGDGELALAR